MVSNRSLMTVEHYITGAIIVASTVMIMSLPKIHAADQGLAGKVSEVWKREAVYKQPPHKQFKQFRDLVSSVVSDLAGDGEATIKRNQKAAAKAGFSLELISESGATFILLKEKDVFQGGGIYIFRTGHVPNRPILLQAPHSKSDARTGDITYHLLQQTDITALYCNSMKRGCNDRDDDEEDSPCDMAHNPKALFQAATMGFCMTLPESLVVQIHGFKSYPQLKGSDGELIIISQGRNYKPDLWPINLFTSLFREVYGEKVLVYDRDTNLLGGTSNVQGDYVNGLSRGGFLHIELSRRLRDRLATEPQVMFDFLKLFKRAISAYQNSEKKTML